MSIKVERIYQKPEDLDGYRILVDRLWPRGISKANAHLDLWLKEVAPSNDLRKWFGHDPAKFAEFAQRYRDELADNPALEELKQAMASHDKVILLYGAKDQEHNQAVILKSLLEED